MFWIYLAVAVLIAWGVYRDLAKKETWMIAFGKVVRSEKPETYWLIIVLRIFLFMAVVTAACLRTQL